MDLFEDDEYKMEPDVELFFRELGLEDDSEIRDIINLLIDILGDGTPSELIDKISDELDAEGLDDDGEPSEFLEEIRRIVDER